MNAFRRSLLILLFGCLLVPAWATPLRAQSAVALRQGPEAAPEDQARRIREEFVKVLAQYPPSVGAVLKLDPSLLASDQYLAPYPALLAFFSQHPEVRRSPGYYFEPISTSGSGYYYDPRARAWDNLMDMVGVFVVMVTIAGSLGWLVRTAMDYRRWGRLAKVQAEAHTKLLDRFTGNEELLAYVKSPAGMRFLQSAPIALDGSPRPMGSSLSRILWSMQAGVVLTAAGIGMNYLSHNIDPDHAEPIYTLSVILLSVGVGFVVSAGLSYFLSRRFGLLTPEPPRDTTEA